MCVTGTEWNACDNVFMFDGWLCPTLVSGPKSNQQKWPAEQAERDLE